MKHINILAAVLLFLSLSTSYYASDKESNKRLKSFINSISEETIGNYDDAIKLLSDIYDQYKDDYLLNIRMGWLNYLAKDYTNSIKYYKEAVRISDRSIESLLGITYPYSAQEKWDEIKNVYKEILDIDPHNYTANVNLGKIYFGAGDYLNSKSILEKLYSNYPGDYSINLYLGWTYYNLGSKSKAHEYFVTALIINPDDASAIEGLNLSK